MNKNLLYGILIVIVIGMAGYFMLSKSDIKDPEVLYGEAQIVKLAVVNGQYVLTPSVLKQGKVRLEGDVNKMPGCAKSVVISAFGVRKVFSSTDNKVEFNADKSGTFSIACSMNMYRGSFQVE